MARPVTLVTGQWTDLPLAELAPKASSWGYDGLELVCRSGYIDVAQAAVSKGYCNDRLALLKQHGLRVFAISNHAAGHLVCDLNDDSRTDVLAPPDCAGSRRSQTPMGDRGDEEHSPRGREIWASTW